MLIILLSEMGSVVLAGVITQDQAIAGIVVGSILLLFLLGLLFGLVMIGRDGDDDTPSEDSPATTVTTTEGADASEAPPTTGSSPGSPPAGRACSWRRGRRRWRGNGRSSGWRAWRG